MGLRFDTTFHGKSYCNLDRSLAFSVGKLSMIESLSFRKTCHVPRCKKGPFIRALFSLISAKGLKTIVLQKRIAIFKEYYVPSV